MSILCYTAVGIQKKFQQVLQQEFLPIPKRCLGTEPSFWMLQMRPLAHEKHISAPTMSHCKCFFPEHNTWQENVGKVFYPYAPIPFASGFGEGFGYLNTFWQGIGSTRASYSTSTWYWKISRSTLGLELWHSLIRWWSGDLRNPGKAHKLQCLWQQLQPSFFGGSKHMFEFFTPVFVENDPI